MPEILELTPKTTKIPRRIQHADAAVYWRENNYNIAGTARQFSVDRNSVAQWIEHERWHDWVRESAAVEAHIYEEASRAAFSKAKQLVDTMLNSANIMAAKLADALEANHSVDEMDCAAVNQTVNTAIGNADKLFNWSKIKVEHSGEVAYRDASAQQLQLVDKLRKFDEEARA